MSPPSRTRCGKSTRPLSRPGSFCKSIAPTSRCPAIRLFSSFPNPSFYKRAAFHAEALNHALDGISADKVRIHVCWGNYEGPHTHDIDLAKIIKIVFGVRAQGIALEAANPRHAHEWAVWKDIALPDDKVLLPGVIDTSTNYVEHPALVAERIVKFASVVGRERVIANTDCGFGTAAGSRQTRSGGRVLEA